MEMTAILRAFQYVPLSKTPITLYTDSTYCKNVINSWAMIWEQDGWRTSTGSAVKNVDLIKELMALIDLHKEHREVNVRWVKGHAGIAENESVDISAGTARRLRETNWDTAKDNKHL
jgi:ribonuclease HI